MKNFAIFGGAAALFAVAAPAHADWRYTNWTMSSAQVAAASSGLVTVGSAPPENNIAGYEVEATGEYRSGGNVFDAIFYFQNHRLAMVKLDLRGSSPVTCFGLERSLTVSHGNPFEKNDGSSIKNRIWHDQRQKNRIDYTSIVREGVFGMMCSVIYRPLLNDNF